VIESLWSSGYSGLDVVGTLFRLVKFEDMDEGMKLEFVKARRRTGRMRPPADSRVSGPGCPPSAIFARRKLYLPARRELYPPAVSYICFTILRRVGGRC
jgi:hypothetical protein